MRRFIAARLAQSAIVVVVVTMVAFALLHLAPGEPFTYDSPNVTPAIRAQWREQFGYGKPLPVQFARYVSSVARGQFGYSTLQHRPARDAIAEALPRTLVLSGTALIIAFIFGAIFGMIAAAQRSRWPDRVISSVAVLLFSIPDFWLALIIQLSLAFWIRALPIEGTATPLVAEYESTWGIFVDHMRHLVLPALSMALLIAAIVSRFQRAALLDVIPSDYIRTARAKGLPERSVIARHALRNALTPTITVLGLFFPTVLGGTFFVEYVFNWHGLGQLTVDAVQALDYDVATASVIIAGVLTTLASLMADVVTALLDPRTRDA